MTALRELALVSVLLLAGCKAPMTNAEIIAATKQCEDAGMHAQLLGSDLDMRVRIVQCVPKDTK